MKPIRSVLAVLAISVASLTTAHAQTPPPTTPPGAGFSFAVYGDSRSMMYLPPKSDQRAEAIKLLVTMFELVMPEKIAEEVVQKNVKLTYDPATKELVQVVMWISRQFRRLSRVLASKSDFLSLLRNDDTGRSMARLQFSGDLL